MDIFTDGLLLGFMVVGVTVVAGDWLYGWFQAQMDAAFGRGYNLGKLQGYEKAKLDLIVLPRVDESTPAKRKPPAKKTAKLPAKHNPD